VPEAVVEPVKAAEAVYLTALQVAELIQVDEKTVLRWSLQDASMPVLRRGRVVRFPRERLLTWLERQEPRGARRSAQAQHKSPTA
jgi:excisionase family DNA binding protein